MKVLHIPRINIQNANALSSPYTIGFPAMTAWLGAVHALERKLADTDYADVRFKSVGVVCHKMGLQTFKGEGDFDHSIIGTANPSVADEQYKKKYGNLYSSKWDAPLTRPPFVEEARCHLTISLVIEYEGLGFGGTQDFPETIDELIQGGMKMAGGDILSSSPTKFENVGDDGRRMKLLRQLMPGFCLVERRDLMQQAMSEGLDGLDALLSFLKVTHSASEDDNGKVTWQSQRKEKGWLVPIATGFHGITELGKAKNQRDPDTPHRFAESLVTLGEFIMPYRIEQMENMMWQYETDMDNNLYYCKQKQPIQNTGE